MASANPVTFAQLLRRFRKTAKVTQEELAARTGIAVRTISDLERGVSHLPHPDTVARLADAFSLGPPARAAFVDAAQRRRMPLQTNVASALHDTVVFQSPGATSIVGRARELAHINQLLHDHYVPPLLLLASEPGMGKSSLLDEAARRAKGLGWRVIAGGCSRLSGQEPYAPFADALAANLASLSLTRQRSELDGCSWLSRLLPELLETGAISAPRATLPPLQERRMLFAAVRRYLANASGPAGTLLALDDLQSAGADAVDLLTSLIRATRAADGAHAQPPLRVIATYRDTEVRGESPLGIAATDLIREGYATKLALGLLSKIEAEVLFDTLMASFEASTSIDPALRDKVLRRVDRMPFYLVSYALTLRAHLGAEDSFAVSIDDLPQTIAESIMQRVAQLPEAARALLGLVAVIGRAASYAFLADCAQLPEDVLLPALDAACQERLLIEVADKSANGSDAVAYCFTHDLIQEAILHDMSAARRSLLHRAIGEVIERQAVLSRRGASRPGELAYHFEQAGEYARTVRYAVLAGDEAEALYAHAEAAERYRAAIRLAAEIGDQSSEAEALKKLGIVLDHSSQYEEALSALEQAAERYEHLRQWDGFAGTIVELGRVYDALGRREQALARLESMQAVLFYQAMTSPAIRALPHTDKQPGAHSSAQAHGLGAALAAQMISPATAVQVEVVQAALLNNHGHYVEALEACARAEVYVQTTDDTPSQVLIHRLKGRSFLSTGRLDEATESLRAANALAEVMGDNDAQSVALSNLGAVAEMQGRPDKAEQYFSAALEHAERLAHPQRLALLLCNLGSAQFTLGAWASARMAFERATTTMSQISASFSSAFPPLRLGILSLAEGKRAVASALLNEATRLAIETDHLNVRRQAQIALAESELLDYQWEQARARLEPLLMPPGQHEYYATWLLPLLAWVSLQQGKVMVCERYLRETLQWATAEQNQAALLEMYRIQALLAIYKKRWPTATSALEQVLALAAPMPHPYFEVKAHYVYGALHAAQGDLSQAQSRFEKALAICARLGERLYAEHIEHDLATMARRR